MRNLSLRSLILLSGIVISLGYGDEKSPVHPDRKLEPISADFGLADGPAWDGFSLTIADPKAQKGDRWIPSKDQWIKGIREKRVSASFFNHGTLYFCDNGNGAILKKNESNQYEIVHQEDLAKDKTRRPNDLVVDRSGGIYFTLTRAGQVIYISPSGKSSVAAKGVETANGIILSPDEKILYVAEYVPKKIVAYDVGEGGVLSNRRLFAEMDDGEAKGADGMSIDRAGNVYCAGAMDIWVWAPDGQLLDRISCPERPINCTFGGTDLRDLYITGFGGLYKRRMRVSGVSPQPPAVWPANKSKVLPSVSLPDGVTPHLDLTYAKVGTRKMLADIFVPKGEGPHPGVVILHGGGWHSGDKMKFRAMGLELTKRGYVTMAVAYRLSEEAKFPANIEDCHAAVRFFRANAKDYQLDPDRIGVVGGSAGAHLAGLLATSANVEAVHGDGGNVGVSSAVQAAVVMSGPMEIATGNVAERSLSENNKKPNAVWLFGGSVKEKPELYQLADAHQKIDKNTPPILFQFGGNEDPSKIEPSIKKLRSLGIPTKLISNYKDGDHGCWNRHPWFLPMVDDIEAWMNEHLKN